MHFSAQDSFSTHIVRDEKMTRTSFVANVGGLLGLCMGFSLVSVAEILYYMFKRQTMVACRRGVLERSACTTLVATRPTGLLNFTSDSQFIFSTCNGTCQYTENTAQSVAIFLFAN